MYRNWLPFYTLMKNYQKEKFKNNPIYYCTKKENKNKNKKTGNKNTKETLIKEVEDDTNKWKDTLCSLMKGINIVKMSTPPKEIYRLYAIPFKILMAFFTKLEQETFQCIWNHKRL